MKHPTREDLISLLYDELPAPRKGELQNHLDACPDCKRTAENWRSTMHRLDDWATSPAVTRFKSPPTLFKWAAAALFLIVAGFAAGRLTPDTTSLEAKMYEAFQRQLDQARTELRTSLAQQQSLAAQQSAAELEDNLAELNNRLDRQIAEVSQTLVNAAAQLESRQKSDYASLRKELETVAILTEAALKQAQRQLRNIASYTQTASQ